MDLEKLTKQQIVLLVMLVSFITSIATGIITVALMEQAPASVTNTINRIVEKTVETVVPNPSDKPSATKEVTVVMQEDDLIVESVQKSLGALTRIYAIEDATSTPPVYVYRSLAVNVSKGGLLVGSGGSYTEEIPYIAKYKGRYYPIIVRSTGHASGITIFAFVGHDAIKTIDHVRFADEASLKIGQKLISLAGEDQDEVGVGVLSSLITGEILREENDGKVVREMVLKEITTTIPSDKLDNGSPILNIFGELVGFSVRKNGITQQVPSRVLQAQITSALDLP